MTDQDVLQKYVNMVPFLGEVLGEGVEIIIHDITDPEHSLIAMCHNLSGRELGNPLTDLARDIVNQGSYKTSDYIANYSGKSSKADFLSSTYFIKNEGRLIGLLCINKDMSSVNQLERTLKLLHDQFNLSPNNSFEIQETFEHPMTGMIHNRIAEVITEIGVEPSRMSVAEKVAVLHKLKTQGVLTVKGAMAEVAAQLGVSVPTAYRYLNKAD